MLKRKRRTCGCPLRGRHRIGCPRSKEAAEEMARIVAAVKYRPFPAFGPDDCDPLHRPWEHRAQNAMGQRIRAELKERADEAKWYN